MLYGVRDRGDFVLGVIVEWFSEFGRLRLVFVEFIVGSVGGSVEVYVWLVLEGEESGYRRRWGSGCVGVGDIRGCRGFGCE